MATDIIAIIPIILSLIALGVSFFAFYIPHRRAKKSEGIRVSREIWDRIDRQERFIENWTMQDHSSGDSLPPMKAMDSLMNELNYFVYLTENGEIKDATIREYYRKRLLPIFMTVKTVEDWNPDYEYAIPYEIVKLIEKYHNITGKMDVYRKEFKRT
jgi:hypothetical protein